MKPQIRMKPYIQAYLKTTEDDMMPEGYVKYKRKAKRLIIESKMNDGTSFPDQVCGVLQPIVYALNKGKEIKPNSAEHKSLLVLLEKANV